MAEAVVQLFDEFIHVPYVKRSIRFCVGFRVIQRHEIVNIESVIGAGRSSGTSIDGVAILLIGLADFFNQPFVHEQSNLQRVVMFLAFAEGV